MILLLNLLNLTLSLYILEFHFEDDASLSVTLISFFEIEGFFNIWQDFDHGVK